MIDWQRALESAADRLLAGAAPNLAESIRYSLLSGGKRFRPRLMEASAELLGVASASLVPFSVALEMIHAFTLVHDDLPCMDDDDLRRGRPTNHKVYGEALALLAGDALVPMAFENCVEAAPHLPADSWIRAFRRLVALSGPRGVIGGQALEMVLSGNRSIELLREMHSLKTGALFDAAILVPADLAGIASESREMQALTRFSRAFGLAFQTADDLQDAEQERDPSSGRYPETSVLHYLPAEAARSEAVRELDEAMAEIRGLWPASHAALIGVAQQLRSGLGTGG